MDAINGEFNRQVDLRVLDLWREGRVKEFLDMLPDYARLCQGECGMIDTAMLFGALGWESCRGHGEPIGEFFGSTGTGQVNVDFSLRSKPAWEMKAGKLANPRFTADEGRAFAPSQ